MKKIKTKAELEQRIKSLEAQLIHRLHFSAKYILKCAGPVGVILHITDNGGKTIVEPTALQLSEDTVALLQRDMVTTYYYQIELKPTIGK